VVWDFDGNGSPDAFGAEVSHTYASAGEKTFRMTVADSPGGVRSESFAIRVLPNRAPVRSFASHPPRR
jgi:cytochrome c